MADMRIRGAKAGQKEPRKPNISKDTAASISTAKLLYGLAEGEIYGLADGAKSIRLDGTPLVDDAGNPNFEGVTWDFRNGSNDQEYIKGFPDVSNETPVNVELRSSQPWIKAFNDTQISAVRVRFKWNRLSETNGENGDVTGYKIDYAIDLQTDGGAYQTVLTTKIQDKTSAGYERTHRIDLPKAKTGWQLRVRRITPNSTSDLIQDTMMIDAVAEVIDVKLSYPNTALLGVQYNAELFSNIAKMSVRLKGKIIRVPDNYDPVARTYTGIWTGNFKDAYSNNPAWVFYDLCTQWRGGLGERLDATMIDRWSLYALGQYCDQPVSDGQGGLEPRFTCNVYLQKQEEAYTVLQNIAGIFRAMSFWTGERIMLDADVPQDSIYTYSSANIVGGVAGINYSGTRNRDRHTLAKVAWDNPNNDYQTEYEYIRDEKAMSKFGVKVLDLSAFGCTSQAQAQRAGLWALKTEQLETRQVTFSVGLDGAIPRVGNIISLSDEAFAGRANGGRVSTVNSTQRIIELDREVVASVGDVLIINGGSGKSERRNISNVVGNRITVTAGFTSAEPEHVWAIETADLKLMRFRVMSITENDDATYAITAIQHEPQKYDAIDFGTDVKPTEITIVNPDTVDAPDTVSIESRHREVQGQTVTTLVIGWSQVKGAVAYDVEWRKDDGNWVKVPRTGNVSVEIEGVYSGNYTARVRAISAFDVQSQPTTSILTEVKGKIGLPPTIVGLTATGILFGMELKWGFVAGSGDAAYTEIQVGSAPDVNVATLTQVSYPTNTHTVTGLQGNLSQSYRARLVDKLGFKSPWSAWVTGTTDASADKVMDLIQGQIDESSLNDILTSKIADIKINKDAISQETQDRVQAIIDANNRITDEAEDRVEALRLASLRTDGLQEFADNLAEDVNTVTLAQVETDQGVASVKERTEAIEIENGLQASKLTYLSSEIDFGYADKTQYADKSRATAWTFAKTIAHADYTNAQMVRGLSADYQDSSARFTENIELLATKNEATATKTSNLSAQMVGGYDGNDLTKLNSGLLFEESKARATDVEGLAEQISLLSAGVGEQFDSFEIWHFNKDKDGWTGGTYSSDGWLNVRAETITSPAITDLDGAVYKHIKLRIKKVGTPTWQGLLSYTGGSKTITEPSYDADGVALVNWQMEWSGDITSFNLKLASTGDNLNYYSIDWIAVGRPSPGASNASLLRESKVRAAETSANASDLLALRSKIEGGNGVPIESSITKKLDTTANLASTTAEEVSTLKSTYDDDMYGYEGTVQTIARTLASATQAEAERLDLLSADIKPRYADASRYVNINRATQWTHWKTVTADNYAANQRITNLQSEFADSNANFTNELFTLAEKDKSIAADITQLYAETGENYGLIQDVSLAISTPNTGLAAKVTELQGRADAAEILLTEKGEIIFSYGAPPVKKEDKNNVWFKLKNEDNDTVSQTPHQWDGVAWVELKDSAALAAKADAAAAKTAAENKGEVIYSATAPLETKQLPQNLWVDTSLIDGKPANTPKRWDGLDWVAVTDKAVVDAQAAASAAAELAGNKGRVIYSSTEPTKEEDQKAQNLWIDTSGGKNTPKRWAAGAWLTVTDKAATDAQEAADAANQKLEPENLASLVEGSGAFSDEFGSISGQFENFEAVVEGQKTAMEVLSGIGNAEKLKNEIAKARLDKNVTNLNAQSTALTNQINSYTTKIAELAAKRDAPKLPDMTQEQYLSLKAEYQKQIDDITAARTDLTAQKAVIADQVAQLAAEKKVLDDFKEVEDGVRAQHTVKIDNAGKIVGFGLVLQKDGFSAFDVRADRFSISAPSDKPNDVNGNSPFMVLTNPQTIDGVTVPAGTYMRNFYAPKGSIDTLQVAEGAIKSAQIDDLSVTTAKIDNLSVTGAKIKDLAVDTLQIAGNAITVSGIFYAEQREVFNVAKTDSEIAFLNVDSAGGSVSVDFGHEILELFGYGDIPTLVIKVMCNNEVLRSWKYRATDFTKTIFPPKVYLPFIDRPPIGVNRYSVKVAIENTNENNISFAITSRSLVIRGAKDDRK